MAVEQKPEEVEELAVIENLLDVLLVFQHHHLDLVFQLYLYQLQVILLL
jgi:hypothetical protein